MENLLQSFLSLKLFTDAFFYDEEAIRTELAAHGYIDIATNTYGEARELVGWMMQNGITWSHTTDGYRVKFPEEVC